MKKLSAIILSAVVLFAALFSACSAAPEPSTPPVVSAAPSAAPSPEPSPSPTPPPASVTLMAVPETFTDIPELFFIISPQLDVNIPADLGFPVYLDAGNADNEYFAFGQKLDPADGSVIEQGFYIVSFHEEPVTAESAKFLSEGEQLVCRTRSENNLAEVFTIGDRENPYDDSIFTDYKVVRMALDFDPLTAVPVDLAARAAAATPAPTSTPVPDGDNDAGPETPGTPVPTEASEPGPTLVPMEENEAYQAEYDQLWAEYEAKFAPLSAKIKEAQEKLDSGEYTQEQYDEEYHRWDREIRSLDFDFMMAHAELAEKYGYHITIS
ncbi:hypothetical protein [Christensenella intestinihominis]|uniref:hypothetical protein n=1 Tax=Christensenella intestinihominis TaxID=1851429 RepID=UPI0008310187|nr:hypothetical protein [Christensenella intestinihominis]